MSEYIEKMPMFYTMVFVLLVGAILISSSTHDHIILKAPKIKHDIDLGEFVFNNYPFKENITCGERPMSTCERALYRGEWMASTYTWKEPGATDCGIKYITTSKMKKIMGDKKMFVIGDSLMRRHASSIYTALGASGMDNYDFDREEIEIRKRHQYHGEIVFGKGQITYDYTPCFKDVATKLEEDKSGFLKNADIIMIGDGTHYTEDCETPKLGEEMESFIQTLNKTRETYPKKLFIYRSLPRPSDSKRKPVHSQIQEIMRCYLDIPFLDHKFLMMDRDSGTNRMTGDTWAHFNVEARNFFLQSFFLFLDMNT